MRQNNPRPWYVIVGLFLAALALVAVIVYFLYRVRSTLPPFIIAFAIAWLLDPLLDRLQCRGCPRMLAVAGVYCLFLAVFVTGLVFLVPAIEKQTTDLANDVPAYSQSLKTFGETFMKEHQPELMKLKLELPTSIQDAFETYGEQVTAKVKLGIEATGLWIVSNLEKVMWLILIPLIAFYFLNDIDRIRAKAVLFIPAQYRHRSVGVLSRVGTVFSSYVRGLVILCLFYGITVTITLLVLGLKYAIILGVVAGVLYAVPYIGAILLTTLVFLVALATHKTGVGYPIWVAPLCVIALNQVFDLFISPRILGKSVGLHPVLSLFALLAGGKLFGLPGMILAVPIAASIQEVVFEFYPELRAAPKPEKQGPSIIERLRARLSRRGKR